MRAHPAFTLMLRRESCRHSASPFQPRGDSLGLNPFQHAVFVIAYMNGSIAQKNRQTRRKIVRKGELNANTPQGMPRTAPRAMLLRPTCKTILPRKAARPCGRPIAHPPAAQRYCAIDRQFAPRTPDRAKPPNLQNHPTARRPVCRPAHHQPVRERERSNDRGALPQPQWRALPLRDSRALSCWDVSPKCA